MSLPTLSTPFWLTLDALSATHRFWRFASKVQMATRSPVSFFAGYAISPLGGKFLALPLVFLSRLLLAIEEIRTLHLSIQQWKDSFHCPIYLQIPFETQAIGPIPVSLVAEAHWRWAHLLERIKRIAIETLQIAKSLFRLCMKVQDIRAAFTHSEEAAQELFIHAETLVEKIQNNKAVLIEALQSRHPIVEKALTHLPFPVDQKALCDKLCRHIETLSTGCEKWKLRSERINRTAKETFLQGIFGACALIGISKYLPTGFLSFEKPKLESLDARFMPQPLSSLKNPHISKLKSISSVV